MQANGICPTWQLGQHGQELDEQLQDSSPLECFSFQFLFFFTHTFTQCVPKHDFYNVVKLSSYEPNIRNSRLSSSTNVLHHSVGSWLILYINLHLLVLFHIQDSFHIQKLSTTVLNEFDERASAFLWDEEFQRSTSHCTNKSLTLEGHLGPSCQATRSRPCPSVIFL